MKQLVNSASVEHLPGQFLSFALRGEMFAVGIHHVKEIIEYGRLTSVPMMPDFIRGVINLRGAVVPVIDLSLRFGHAPAAIGRRACIVIIETLDEDGRNDVGIIVDSVSEVLELPAAEIEPPPSFGTRLRVDFITGMGRVANGFVIILDILRILSSEELSVQTLLAAEEMAEAA